MVESDAYDSHAPTKERRKFAGCARVYDGRFAQCFLQPSLTLPLLPVPAVRMARGWLSGLCKLREWFPGSADSTCVRRRPHRARSRCGTKSTEWYVAPVFVVCFVVEGDGVILGVRSSLARDCLEGLWDEHLGTGQARYGLCIFP